MNSYPLQHEEQEFLKMTSRQCAEIRLQYDPAYSVFPGSPSKRTIRKEDVNENVLCEDSQGHRPLCRIGYLYWQYKHLVTHTDT